MDKDFLNLLSAVALNRIFGNDPKFSHHLLDSLDNLSDVFDLDGKDRLLLFGNMGHLAAQISQKALDDAEQEYRWLSSRGIQFLPIYDCNYPSLLKECPDAPLLLYVRSSTPPDEIFNRRPAVSVVGTRDMTQYGKCWCERIVAELGAAQEKPAIVSGLAFGIDITAHMAALGHSLPTVAVLPVGIDDVYPKSHCVSAEKIVSAPESALITDFPPGTRALKVNFIRRNRIIAGLSRATILVESRLKGGGTLTCRLAAGYGREVLALPGRLDDVHSEGCNRLVWEKVAGTVPAMENLNEALGIGLLGRERRCDLSKVLEGRYSPILDEADLCMVKIIALKVRKNRGICLDELCRDLNISYSDASRLAYLLESDGILEMDIMQRCCIRVS